MSKKTSPSIRLAGAKADLISTPEKESSDLISRKQVSEIPKLSISPKFKPGTVVSIWHDPVQEAKTRTITISDLKFEKAPIKMLSMPKVSVSFEPIEGDKILFHPTPGFTSQHPSLAQVSVRAYIHNLESSTLDLDSVLFEYHSGNELLKKTAFLPSDQLQIGPNELAFWQNSREYHENGDVIFLEYPFPTSLKISFKFKGFEVPVSYTKKLAPYPVSFGFPMDSSDLNEGEYVSGYSMHGGGDQVFAYDFGVVGYQSSWNGIEKGKKGNENSHNLIWGKPIRAMADGVVLRFENNIPNNWAPFPPNKTKEFYDQLGEKQKNELWGSFPYGGSGNHFYIRHGDLVALYAHMQKGSLTPELMKAGAIVKKGQILGKGGNSGSSSAPHLHVHIKTFKNNNNPESGDFRPLLFNTGFVIGAAEYPSPGSNIYWSKLKNQGIPGQKDKWCLIHPSSTHPLCKMPTNWGEVCRHGIPAENYQKEFDKIWPCGYYPIWIDGFEVNGKTYFNVIFRPSGELSWVSRHHMTGAVYQKEFEKWTGQGYALTHVNSYLSGGKILYAAVWVHGKSMDFLAYHGKSLKWHEDNFKNHCQQGWVPTNVSCVKSNNSTLVTALWEKTNPGGFYAKPAMTLLEFKEAFEQFTGKEKFKLVYLDAYQNGPLPLLSGIWYKNAPNYSTWFEKFNLSGSQFQSEYNNFLGNGFLTRVIAGYSQVNQAKFEGVWSK